MRNTYIKKEDGVYEYIYNFGRPYGYESLSAGGSSDFNIPRDRIYDDLTNFYKKKFNKDSDLSKFKTVTYTQNSNWYSWYGYYRWWAVWSDSSKVYLDEDYMGVIESNYGSGDMFLHDFKIEEVNGTPTATDYNEAKIIAGARHTFIGGNKEGHYQDNEWICASVVYASNTNISKIVFKKKIYGEYIDENDYLNNTITLNDAVNGYFINNVCSNTNNFFVFTKNKLYIINKEDMSNQTILTKPNINYGKQCDANDTYLYATEHGAETKIHRLNLDTQVWQTFDVSFLGNKFSSSSLLSCTDDTDNQSSVYINAKYYTARLTSWVGDQSSCKPTFKLNLDLENDPDTVFSITLPTWDTTVKTNKAIAMNSISKYNSDLTTIMSNIVSTNYIIDRIEYVNNDNNIICERKNTSNFYPTFSGTGNSFKILSTDNNLRISSSRATSPIDLRAVYYKNSSSHKFRIVVFNVETDKYKVTHISDEYEYKEENVNSYVKYDIIYNITATSVLGIYSTTEPETILSFENEKCYKIKIDDINIDDEYNYSIDSVDNREFYGYAPMLEYVYNNDRNTSFDILTDNYSEKTSKLIDINVYVRNLTYDILIEEPLTYNLTLTQHDENPTILTITSNNETKDIIEYPINNSIITTNEDVPVRVTISTRDNEDIDNSNYTYTINSFNSNAFTYTVDPDGTGDNNVIEFYPKPNVYGMYGFNLNVFESNVAKRTYTLVFNITGVNDTPTSSDHNFTITEDTVLNASLTSYDVEGTPRNFVLVDDVTNGILSLNNNGSFSYIGNTNFYGSDSFTFTVDDGLDTSEPYTVNITVTNVNDAPVLLTFPNLVSSVQNATTNIQVTAEDVETDLSSLSFRVFGVNVVGYTDLGSGSIDVDFGGIAGSSTITIEVSDPQGLRDSVTVDNFTEFDWSQVSVTFDPNNMSQYSIDSDIYYYKIYNFRSENDKKDFVNEVITLDTIRKRGDADIQYVFTDFTHLGLPAYNYAKATITNTVNANDNIGEFFIMTVDNVSISNIFETTHEFTADEINNITLSSPDIINCTEVKFNDREYYIIDELVYIVNDAIIKYKNTSLDLIKNPIPDSNNYIVGYKKDGQLYLDRFM